MVLSVPEALTAAHDVTDFTCGQPTLDHWLKTKALSNQEKGFTAVLVTHEQGRVVGYYGLAPTAVVPNILPRSVRTGQPPDRTPTRSAAGQKPSRERRWRYDGGA